MNNLNPNVNVNWVPGITLEEMEKQCILAAFRFYRGNKTQTAQVLGIAIRTLDNKLEKYEDDKKRAEQRYEDDKFERSQTLDRLRGVDITKKYSPGSQSQYPTPSMDAPRRLDVQPTVEIPTQQPLPVSERKEIQGVLPKQASGNNPRGRR